MRLIYALLLFIVTIISAMPTEAQRAIPPTFQSLSNPNLPNSEKPSREENNKSYPSLVPSPKELKKTGSGIVVSVIDALRLQLDDRRIIFLTGLDIPDLYQQEPGNLAFAAKNLLEQIFLDQKVNLYQNPDSRAQTTDRMGNELAHVTLFNNDLWAQGALIADGLARVRTTIDGNYLATEMLALEEAARKNIPQVSDTANEKDNIPPYLWRDDNYKVLDLETVENVPKGYHVVEGIIQKVAIKENRIYLNFGQNWRNDFTVSIKPESRREFSKQGLRPLEWQGRTVRVRGWLEEYNGPYIEVDHPERIEFIDSDITNSKSGMNAFSVEQGDRNTDNKQDNQNKEAVKDALPKIKEFTFER